MSVGCVFYSAIFTCGVALQKCGESGDSDRRDVIYQSNPNLCHVSEEISL